MDSLRIIRIWKGTSVIIKVAKTDLEKEQAFHVRKIVFIEEQQVSQEIERDGFDQTSIHFVGLIDDEPVAAGRVRFIDDCGKLERICVLRNYRGKSYGSKLMDVMEAEILKEGYQKAKLNAQTHAKDFYLRLGYETISAEFYDAGMPHVTMMKKLNSEKAVR